MQKKKKIGEKLRKFSMETRLKSSNEFKDKILEMFKGYIKAVVVWGSITRGDYTGKSDVDIYVIFDDTKMPLKKFDAIRDKVDNDVAKISRSIDPRLHPQPVLALTEFWDGIRGTHPLFYNIVREGYALYDTGFFIPMRKLLEWGKFPATVEAAELRMESVPSRIDRVQRVKLYMIAEDLYCAMTDAAQAVLMYLGVGPPAPKVLAREVRKHLVDNKLLEEKYAKLVEDVMIFRKAVEHKEINEITGAEVDEWIKKTDEYVKRMIKLLKQLEISKKAGDIKKNYEVMIKASVAALKSINKLPEDPKKLPEAFKRYLIESGLVNPFYGDVFGKVIELRKMLEDKKLGDISDRDVYMSKEYVRRFVMDVRNVIQKGGEIGKDLDKRIEEMKKAKEKMKEAEEKVEDAKGAEELPSLLKPLSPEREEEVEKIEETLVDIMEEEEKRHLEKVEGKLETEEKEKEQPKEVEKEESKKSKKEDNKEEIKEGDNKKTDTTESGEKKIKSVKSKNK